jgi:protein-L-isoaspartate(D-aspartate) O-methyltransferase
MNLMGPQMKQKETPNDIRERQLMVRQQLGNRGISSEKVLEIMGSLPRQHFIPALHRSEAYLDQPVSLGQGQTISQPYIVALITEKLQLEPFHRVLEIGTGCGYQTAILARLAQRIYSIERIDSLSRQARENLGALGIANVEYHIGDGALGWPYFLGGEVGESGEKASPALEGESIKAETTEAKVKPGGIFFDRILVAAAGEEAPPALLEQLALDGKMVIPVGSAHNQRLLLLEKKTQKNGQTKIVETLLCYCRFVKLICHST